MNISWAGFKTAFFSLPVYLFSLHGGICGRGALSITAPCTYFLCAAIYPVYIYSLTCLSLLSTVEKEPQTLGQTQKWTNSQTSPKGTTHMYTHCSFPQYNLAVQLLERRDAKRIIRQDGAQLAESCLSVSWQVHYLTLVDRQMEALQGNEQRKRLLPHQRRILQFENERLTRTRGSTRNHTQDRHLFTLFRVSVKLHVIRWCCGFFFSHSLFWEVRFFL